MDTFSFSVKTDIVYGEYKSHTLMEHVRPYTTSNQIVVVTDQQLVKLGIVDPILTGLDAKELLIYDEIAGEPTTKNIDDVARLLRESDSDVVIGIGGGSALDIAKTASLVASGSGYAADYALGAKPFPDKQVSCIAIPTTAGTGAEVTSTTIYADQNHRKLWAWDAQMAPELAILDPSLTTKLPAGLTAATSLDAMIHAIEACTGNGQNPFIEAVSLQAVRLVHENLPVALKDPSSLESRGNLLIGSTLAGIAIEHGGTGLAHCIGHALGSIAQIPHGRAVAIGLYHAYEWNVLSGKDAIFAEIAKSLGVLDRGQTESEIAQEGAKAFKQLIEESPIQLSVADDGLSIDDLERIVGSFLAEENAPMKNNNCHIPEEIALRDLARQVLLAPEEIR